MTGGPAQARARATSATTTSASPTATAWPTSTSRRCSPSTAAGTARDRDRGAAAAAASAPSSSTATDACAVPGEAARRRRLDQRRLLRALARGRRATSTATPRSGSRSRWKRLAADGQLAAYQHDGFWQPMDTLRDRNVMQAAVGVGQRPVEDVGVDPDVLAWPARAGHRPHRLQGRLAGALAAAAGGAGDRARDAAPTSPSLFELARVGEGVERASCSTSATRDAVRAAFAGAAGDRLPPGGATAGAPVLRRIRARPSR